jgi:hypothetical protein
MTVSYLFKFVPWALAMVATALLVTVTRKYDTLSDQITQHRRNDMHLRRGEYFPTFTARTVAGAPVLLGQTGSVEDRQVIFILTAECPYCRKTIPTWKAIAAALDSTHHPHVRVYGLTTDSQGVATQFARSRVPGFPIIVFPEPKLVRLSRALTVPQTLVLSHSGRVLYSRIGFINVVSGVDSVLAAVAMPEPRPRTPPVTSVAGERSGAF